MLYLLTGLPCSGKTTYARRLEAAGAVRVSVDEMMIESVGRLGVDYAAADHVRLLEPVLASARAQLEHHLGAGNDVVFDHGLGRRSERDRLKELAASNGATWELLCFEATLPTLRERCQARSSDLDAVPISSEALDYLAVSWERPDGEGEAVVVTD